MRCRKCGFPCEEVEVITTSMEDRVIIDRILKCSLCKEEYHRENEVRYME